ncbi:SRPBCC family protein [Nocardia sp. NPDC051030]|uniref:SRPBCC family protein n=1 Tax=Nocardia sp. NPDC051030 TaxID=3155162 RepID=UPI00341A198C
MAAITLTKDIAAPPELVFDILTDHRGYADITPLRAVDMECEGTPEPNGVGAIRVIYVLGRAFPAVREQVTEFRSPEHFAYQIVSGLPSRDIHGVVAVHARPGGGARLEYRHVLVPPIPLPDALVRAGQRLVIGFLVRGIAREAELRAAQQVRSAEG